MTWCYNCNTVKSKVVLRSSDWNLSGIFGILLDEFVSDLWTWVIDVYAQYHFINHNTQGDKGYIKEGLELTPMGPFDVEQGGVNSGPDSRGVPDWRRTDGPGFSLCAAPLESSGPGFREGEVGGMNE